MSNKPEETDRPYSEIRKELDSDRIRQKHAAALSQRSKVVTVGNGSEARTLSVETRAGRQSAVPSPLDQLEAEAAELDAQLAAAAAQPALIQQRYNAARAAEAASVQKTRREVELVQAKSRRDAFKAQKAFIDNLRSELRVSVARLKAGDAENFGMLEAFDDGLEALAFASATHGVKAKSHDANVTRAQENEARASAEQKIALAAVREIEAQLAAITPTDDENE